MDKHIQDRLFDIVVHIPTPKISPRELKMKLRKHHDDLIEQGCPVEQADRLSFMRFKEEMEKLNLKN